MNPVNMPELGRYWADADSIGPVPAQFWHVYRERKPGWSYE